LTCGTGKGGATTLFDMKVQFLLKKLSALLAEKVRNPIPKSVDMSMLE
jgi:hypothetical protein